MSAPRERLTYLRDAILFCLGVALILKQAGIGFTPPAKLELELLFIGALFCNGPLFLSYLTARRGTSGSSGEPPPPVPPLPSVPPSDPQSVGEA